MLLNIKGIDYNNSKLINSRKLLNLSKRYTQFNLIYISIKIFCLKLYVSITLEKLKTEVINLYIITML